MRPKPSTRSLPRDAGSTSSSAPSSRLMPALALTAAGGFGGVVGAAVVLFAADARTGKVEVQQGADTVALEARVAELENLRFSRSGQEPSRAKVESQRGTTASADRADPRPTDPIEHPRFAEAVRRVVDELEATRQVEKADEKARRRIDRTLAFVDSVSEELRFSEGQRLEVARILTDESSKYRRAKDELDRAAIDQGLTPRNKRERKAKLRERITAESRDELSRILSPNQLGELLRIRHDEETELDD